MRIGLQEWYDAWRKRYADTDLLYIKKTHTGEPTSPQIHFVRDDLSRCVMRGIAYEDVPKETGTRRDCRYTADVIGTHHSKSVELPVYEIARPDLGLRFVLRDNFYDWNVSVISEKPIETDLRGFVLDFDKDSARDKWWASGTWGYCFFQGFPEDCCFGPYALDKRKFSTYMNSDHMVHTFVWLIMRDLVR